MRAFGNGSQQLESGSATPELASALAELGTTLVRSRGTVLFEQGHQPIGVFLLRKGKVRLSLDCDDVNLTYRTVGAGYVLGLPSTIGDRPYSLTAETIEDCTFSVVKRAVVLDLLSKRTDLSLQVVAMLAEEVTQMRKRVGQFAAEV